MKDPAQVLEDAADVQLVHGRSRCVGHDSEGRFCVLGAIAEAVEPGWFNVGPDMYWPAVDGRNNPAAHAAVRALAERIPNPWGIEGPTARVYTWNDELADDDEVRDTLLLAAKDLRAGAHPS